MEILKSFINKFKYPFGIASIIIAFWALAALFLVFAMDKGYCGVNGGDEAKEKAEATQAIQEPCPETTMISSCLDCHEKGSFRIPEESMDASYEYPNGVTKIREIDGKLMGIFDMDGSIPHPSCLQDFFFYMQKHGIKHVILDIHSPGGYLLVASKYTSIMEYWKAKGYIIQTNVHGFAASAAVYISVGGSKGFRFVGPTAELMWHELAIGQFFKIVSPSSSEDEALVLRHLQDTTNNWLADHSNLTKKQLDEKIHKKEFWMNGIEAVEYGFADGVFGAKK